MLLCLAKQGVDLHEEVVDDMAEVGIVVRMERLSGGGIHALLLPVEGRHEAASTITVPWTASVLAMAKSPLPIALP